jgi:hypothetical protein
LPHPEQFALQRINPVVFRCAKSQKISASEVIFLAANNHEVPGEAGGFLQIKLLESFAKVKDQKFGRSSKFLVEIYLSLRLVRRAVRAGKLCGLCDFSTRWFSGVVCRFSRWYLGQAGGRPSKDFGALTRGFL